MDPVTAAMAAKVGGSLLDNMFAKNRQEDAQAFSAQQYATRYQTQTEDMKKAGLNPMLSVSQGAGTSPQSSAATPGSNFTSALDKAQMEVLTSQARKNNAEATITEDVGLDQAKATLNQTLQNTGLTAAQIQKVNAETENAIAQLQNIKDENLKIKRAAELLYQQANLASQQQLSETQKYEVLKAQAKLIVAQTGLANLDIQAANALDNLGRTSQQLKPIVDMLRVFLRK
jgi:HSP90 family molecular chaperone